MKKIISMSCWILYCSLITGQVVDSIDIGARFVAAGFMGCDRNITIQDAWTIRPHSSPICYKMFFTTSCSKGWAGVYWTNVADDNGANWGQYPGVNLSGNRFTKLTFWARGERGGEVVEFGTGGIDNVQKDSGTFKYRDSYSKTTVDDRVVILENVWKQYTIDLHDKDFSSVIGGFYWVANWSSNPAGLIFYLDDIKLKK